MVTYLFLCPCAVDVKPSKRLQDVLGGFGVLSAVRSVSGSVQRCVRSVEMSRQVWLVLGYGNSLFYHT